MKRSVNFLRQFGFFQYGKVMPGLTLHGRPAPYPVLNERAIRAGAGLMFLAGSFAFFQAFYLQEYIYLQIFVSIFFFDFFMKVIVGTKFSPISRVANLIVQGQEPEYVGAIQKRFAWAIGLFLSGTMVLLLLILGVTGPINLLICSICLTFMFLETAFGICVGCKIYGLLLRSGVIARPEHKPVCPGNVCAIE